jgi:hypothetical protein
MKTEQEIHQLRDDMRNAGDVIGRRVSAGVGGESEREVCRITGTIDLALSWVLGDQDGPKLDAQVSELREQLAILQRRN